MKPQPLSLRDREAEAGSVHRILGNRRLEREKIMERPSLDNCRRISAPPSAGSARRATGAALPGLMVVAAMALASTIVPREAGAQDSATSESAAVFNSSKVCAQTTSIMDQACGIQAKADYGVAVATCNNDADEATRKSCLSQAKDDFASAKDDCSGQSQARQSVCGKVGPGPYDPVIDPSNFTNSTSITNSFLPFPVGRIWTYDIINKGDTAPSQIDTVEVTNQTITLLGVKCVAVHDYQVDAKTNELTEDTYDFYAQDSQGNVWYFGESSTTYDEWFHRQHGGILEGWR